MRHHLAWTSFGVAIVVTALTIGAPRVAAAPADPVLVSTLEVSATSGEAALPRGAEIELKIYEQGPVPRVYPLTHGEPWPAAATRLFRVRLDRPLDPRRVRRYSLAYRGQAKGLTSWEIESAFVEWQANGERQRLLATTLSGVLAVDRELASEELRDAQLLCATDSDCDNGRSCDGVERCEPRSRYADARGCVAGHPVICPVNQVCVEHAGCRGLKESSAAPPAH